MRNGFIKLPGGSNGNWEDGDDQIVVKDDD
jgi:hypothetical protein